MSDFLDTLELSVRAIRILRDWGGIDNVDAFLALTRAEVMTVKGAGLITWREIEDVQREFRRKAIPAKFVKRAYILSMKRGDHYCQLSFDIPYDTAPPWFKDNVVDEAENWRDRGWTVAGRLVTTITEEIDWI